MANAKSSNRRPRHYYTPGRIESVAGVEHKPIPSKPGIWVSYIDLYVGDADALERSGLLRRDMLPTPPSYSIAWRPNGMREESESWCQVPGYMEIRRHPSGRYHVQLTVSRQEQEERRSVFQQASEEQQGREHRVETQDLAPDERALIEVHRRMPAPIKPVALLAVQEIAKATSDAEKTCWISIWRACCEAANHGMPAEASSRGHLRLVWSVPKAPAWTSDL